MCAHGAPTLDFNPVYVCMPASFKFQRSRSASSGCSDRKASYSNVFSGWCSRMRRRGACMLVACMHACVAMLRIQLYFWFRDQVPQPWQHVEPVLAWRCPFVHDAGKRVDSDPTTEATPFADHFGAVAGCICKRKWRRRGRHITDTRWACRGAGRAVTTRRCGWTHDTAHVCLVSRQWCSFAAGRWSSVTEARRISAAATAPACVGYLST